MINVSDKMIHEELRCRGIAPDSVTYGDITLAWLAMKKKADPAWTPKWTVNSRGGSVLKGPSMERLSRISDSYS
jgi:hypothetical protein